MRLTPEGGISTPGLYPDGNGVTVQMDSDAGGFATLDVTGTNPNVQLEQQPPFSDVWLDVGAAVTAAGSSAVTGLSARKFRVNVIGGTNVQVSLNP